MYRPVRSQDIQCSTDYTNLPLLGQIFRSAVPLTYS